MTTTTTIHDRYKEAKAEYPDALILMRCGDFYESYDDDAVRLSCTVGITLTKRSADGLRMAGFPHHALDIYLPKLIRAGYRVCITD